MHTKMRQSGTTEGKRGVSRAPEITVEDPERWASPIDLAATVPDRRRGGVLTREAAGRFDYVGKIGAGGMGAVHCVRDRNLMREVAYKELTPSLAGDLKYVRKFKSEAQIQAQLDHPNIVPVHDFCLNQDGSSYFTMRMVRGRRLADWIAAVHGSPSSADSTNHMLGVFLKVCDAVAFAHSRGVLHLDIKPENIIVEDFGAVYLMDWGLARLIAQSGSDGDQVETSAGVTGNAVSGVVGSPSYMSPEQALGPAATVTERTDVFGLGGVLYAILAGRPPYQGDSVNEVLEQARSGEVEPLPGTSRGIPLSVRIRNIARKALAPCPDDRYQTVQELQREVESFLHGGLPFPIVVFAAGERILTEGEPGDTAFVIVKGTCVAYSCEDGVRSTMRELGAGAVLGAEAVFMPGPCSATVEAVSEVEARVVTHKMLAEGLGHDSWFGAFVTALAERLRAVHDAPQECDPCSPEHAVDVEAITEAHGTK